MKIKFIHVTRQCFVLVGLQTRVRKYYVIRRGIVSPDDNYGNDTETDMLKMLVQALLSHVYSPSRYYSKTTLSWPSRAALGFRRQVCIKWCSVYRC